MADLSWKEFKEQVEAQGVTDDMRISYIDVYGDYDVTAKITGNNHCWIQNDHSRYREKEEDQNV